MPDQVLLVDKPYRWTSFDVVKKLRKPLTELRRKELPENDRAALKWYKVGHAGTLDPLATGLLIICTGKLTTQISSIQEKEKEYVAGVTLGGITESYDLEKPITNQKSFGHVKQEDVLIVLKKFTGEILQLPPIHSAVKVDGRRAYEHARKGEDPELKPRPITVYELELLGFEPPEIRLRIVCSKGTYIRSLAHDIGRELGTGAYLSSLRRTRIGEFLVKDARSPAEILSELSEKQ
jgi:tRNA pseudouridine55 synthase